MGKRAPAGSVSIRNNNRRLQLMFRLGTVRHYISLGLADTRTNRSYAQLQASQLEMDILSGKLDRTFAKYKPATYDEPQQESPLTPKTLPELWESYTEYKRPQLSPSTIGKDFKRVERHLQRCPYNQLDKAVAIRDHLLTITTPSAAKKILTQISACCSWAVKSGLIEANLFDGMATDINPAKDKRKIEFFTTSERDEIVRYFWDTNNHHSPLVEFLFRVGCRPSEALALEWRHISANCDRILFEQALVEGDGGSILKKGLKTQARREFPCGANLAAFIRSIKPPSPQPYDVVFPGERARHIDMGNFTTRHWKPALLKLGIRYRSPYKMRHTYITQGLQALGAQDIAELAGNSATIIYSTYAGVLSDLVSPDF